MSFLYNFGLSQEDERTESAALALSDNDRVLSIASAGDMPLSLLALGARQIDAVDVDPAQLHLSRLKLAAVRSLEREDAIAFLGFLPASSDDRLAWLQRLVPALPDASRRFWLGNRTVIEGGAIWAGRYEQYVAKLVRVAMPLFGRTRFDALFACTTLEQQQEVFDKHFDRRSVRALFDIGFHPKLFSSRGMDPRSLQHRSREVPLGQQYFSHFRNLCTATPARDNHLLQLTLLGRVRDADVVPTYLSARGAEQIRKRSDALRFVQQDLVSYLEDLEPEGFDKAHLSNLPDWLDQDAFDHVMSLLATKAAPGARLVWRYIHVNRSVPEHLREHLPIDEDLGQSLRRTDRFPFYAIVCASVEGQDDRGTGTRTRAFRSPARTDSHPPSHPDEQLAPGFDFRPIGPEQGEAMLAINRACPIEADFSVIFDRGSDFFRWPDLIYDRYHYVGIYRDDRLVGYCMTGELSGWTGASHGRCFYGGDARVLRTYRGNRVAELAFRRALELLADDVEVGMGLVKQGNAPAQRTVDKGYSDRFEEVRRIPFEVANVLLLRRMRQPRLEVRRAKLDDLPAMVELFNETNARRLFAPKVDLAFLQKNLELPGLELRRWYVVERGGRLIGMAAAWDQHAFHRTMVLRYSPAGAALRTLYSAGRKVLRNAAPLPGEGESFRAVTLSRVAIANADPSVLRSLITGVANDHVGHGYHMLHVGFAGDDPLRAATTGLLCQRFRSQVLITPRRGLPRCEGWFDSRPYIDLAMI